MATALIHSTGQTTGPASVYFERFAPASPTDRPTVVMIHGGAHSGSCYQRTADGRPGWAYDFVARGYPVVVPDWPGVGRSGHIPADRLTGEIVVDGLSSLVRQLSERAVLLTHSMAGCYGWRLAELHADAVQAIVGVTPSPPGNIQPDALVLTESKEFIEIETFGRRLRIDLTAPNFPSNETILGKYIGDSRFFPRDRIAEYTAGLLAVPPRIAVQRRNVRGRQIRMENPSALKGLPALVVTGTSDIDHPRETDAEIVDWLIEHGAIAEFCYLGDRGIIGNGHMLMIEENSADIASIILDWLDEFRMTTNWRLVVR